MTDSIEFRRCFQAFIRSIDGGTPAKTPCGQRLSPSEAHALMALRGEGSNRLSQQGLAAALSLDKSNAARICEALEKKGWIRRSKSETDGRALLLSLTAKGERVADRVDQSSRAFLGKVLRELPDRDRGRAMVFLQALTLAFQKAKEGSV